MYYKLNSIGKGTIAHDDWAALSFVLHTVSDGIVAELTGDESDCTKWAERVKATVMKESDALAAIKTAEIAGLEAEKIAKTSELSSIDSKLTSLKAV